MTDTRQNLLDMKDYELTIQVIVSGDNWSEAKASAIEYLRQLDDVGTDELKEV